MKFVLKLQSEEVEYSKHSEDNDIGIEDDSNWSLDIFNLDDGYMVRYIKDN